MNSNNQEVEAKFLVKHLDIFEQTILALGGKCLIQRQLELNLRLDTPTSSLKRQHKVLRLRKYTDMRLTFKKEKQIVAGVATRVEIETPIVDFEQTQAILAELGFKPYLSYEKYRAVYQLKQAQIMLDEMPFGCFVEIEAADQETVLSIAQELKLNNHKAISESYQGLFEAIKTKLNLTFNDISFENFSHLTVTAADMQAEFAD